MKSFFDTHLDYKWLIAFVFLGGLVEGPLPYISFLLSSVEWMTILSFGPVIGYFLGGYLQKFTLRNTRRPVSLLYETAWILSVTTGSIICYLLMLNKSINKTQSNLIMASNILIAFGILLYWKFINKKRVLIKGIKSDDLFR